MSLATRCPACHTVFRVVQDQLRVSEGWVRCGQCQEVFNALETLFDLGPLGVAEPAGAAAAEQGASPATTPSPSGADERHDTAVPATMSLDQLAEAPIAEPVARPRDSVEVPAAVVAGTAATPRAVDAPLVEHDEDDAEAPTPSRFMGPAPDWARQPARERRNKKSKSKQAIVASDTQAQAHQSHGAHRRRRKPQFVRQAERAAMWRRPMMRALLGGSAFLLVVMLVLQVGYQYREPLAAQVPALAPSLRTACASLGCRIGAPRAIERIRLDASDLTRTEEEQVLRLSADVHNTADYAVRTPALDVSFTDALGRTISRKVLLPAELGARGEAIDADAQWRVEARLAVGELRIAGYTVEVFYP